MSKSTISRRGFLKGSGRYSLALPFLPSLPLSSTRALAQGEQPRRFFVLFNAHPPRNQLQPKNQGRNYTLSECLEPLARHKKNMLVMSGLDLKYAIGVPGSPHYEAAGQLFTGTKDKGKHATSLSVDQYIGKKFANYAPFQSITAGLANPGRLPHQYFFKGDGGQIVPFENSPTKIYDRVFKGFNPDAGGSSGPSDDAIKERLRNTSVLDFVLEDYNSVKRKLGSVDKMRLDGHVEAIFELEKRLSTTVGGGSGAMVSGSACKDLSAPAGNINANDPNNIPTLIRQHFDVATMAFACDRTRVMTLSNSGAKAEQTHGFIPGIPANPTLHTQSHGDRTGKILTLARRFYATELAKFVDTLENTIDFDGSPMLDNTLILWAGELGNAASAHDNRDYTFVTIGGKNLGIDNGQHKRYPQRSSSDLNTTILHAMGIKQNVFGDAIHNNGPMDVFT